MQHHMERCNRLKYGTTYKQHPLVMRHPRNEIIYLVRKFRTKIHDFVPQREELLCR